MMIINIVLTVASMVMMGVCMYTCVESMRMSLKKKDRLLAMMVLVAVAVMAAMVIAMVWMGV